MTALKFEIRDLDEVGLLFIMNEEDSKFKKRPNDFLFKPYLDTSKIPTIGVGMTWYPDTGVKVTLNDPPITKLQAMVYYHMMVKNFEKAVWSSTRDDINQNQFNALVSLCYRAGPGQFRTSTLLKRVNKNPNDRPGITEAFLMWRYDEGKPILLPRAKREAALYFK